MSQSIHRAAVVLEHVSVRPRTQSEIAALLDVHRSTALRILQTLTEAGLTTRRVDGTYGIGYRLAGLASIAAEQFELRDIARPTLAALARESGHTVHLAVLEGTQIVYADKIETAGRVRMYSQVGQPVRLHTSGVGKAILAWQSDDTRNRMLDGYDFSRCTDTTILTRRAFDSELSLIRERGWAVDDGEFEEFINCIAMPVHDVHGEVIAGVSITALRAIADLDALDALLPKLAEATAHISQNIGWRP